MAGHQIGKEVLLAALGGSQLYKTLKSCQRKTASWNTSVDIFRIGLNLTLDSPKVSN